MIVRSVIPTGMTGGGPPPSGPARKAASALMAAKTAFMAGNVPEASAAATTALAALEDVVGQATSARESLIARANAEYDEIVRMEAPEALPTAVPVYDRYFGTKRVVEATVAETATGIAPTMVKLVVELTSIGLPLDDRSALAGFAAHILDPNGQDAGAPIVDAAADIAAVTNDPLERWKVGHAFYGLACRRASVAINLATKLFREDNSEGAAAQLRTAANLVRALTAAMIYAAAMSSDNYGEPVRPSMRPPLLELELTGFMNLDYHVYRRALDGFVGRCNQKFYDLVKTSQALAEARDEVLHLDLVDLERHIALTYRLVGHVPALDESQDGSAVQALRASYVRRLRKYSALLRHGHITGGALEEDS